jgi:hypothetical protein
MNRHSPLLVPNNVNPCGGLSAFASSRCTQYFFGLQNSYQLLRQLTLHLPSCAILLCLLSFCSPRFSLDLYRSASQSVTYCAYQRIPVRLCVLPALGSGFGSLGAIAGGHVCSHDCGPAAVRMRALAASCSLLQLQFPRFSFCN